jgi:hypothetical protein
MLPYSLFSEERKLPPSYMQTVKFGTEIRTQRLPQLYFYNVSGGFYFCGASQPREVQQS